MVEGKEKSKSVDCGGWSLGDHSEVWALFYTEGSGESLRALCRKVTSFDFG